MQATVSSPLMLNNLRLCVTSSPPESPNESQLPQTSQDDSMNTSEWPSSPLDLQNHDFCRNKALNSSDPTGSASSNRRKQQKPSRMAKDATAAAKAAGLISSTTFGDRQQTGAKNESSSDANQVELANDLSANESNNQLSRDDDEEDYDDEESEESEGTFTCGVCTKALSSEDALTKHIIKEHASILPLIAAKLAQQQTHTLHQQCLTSSPTIPKLENNNIPLTIPHNKESPNNRPSPSNLEQKPKFTLPASSSNPYLFESTPSGFPSSSPMMQTSSTLTVNSVSQAGTQLMNLTPSNNNNNNNNRDEDYCELCQKHFCNKYYLRKHKNDVHGIASDPLPNSRSTSHNNSSSGSRTKDFIHQSHHSHLPSLQQSASFNPVVQSPAPSLTHPGMFIAPHLVNPNFMLFNPFAAAAAAAANNQMSSLMNPHFLATSGAPGTTSLFTGTASMVPPPLGHLGGLPGATPGAMEMELHQQLQQVAAATNRASNSGVVGTPGQSRDSETFCDICNKELCNKYFLRIHKAKKHGIKDESIDAISLPNSVNISSSSPLISTTTISHVTGTPVTPSLSVVKKEDEISTASNINETASSTSSPKRVVDASPNATPKPPTSPNVSLPHSVTAGSLSPASRSISDPESFCALCQRDLGNKYALRIHFLSVHATPSAMMDPSYLAAADSSAVVAMAANLSASAGGLDPRLSTSANATVGVPGGIVSGANSRQASGLSPPMDSFKNSMIAAKLADRVMCDLCNKDLCNKYFLKTHKMKVHGVMTTTDGTPVTSAECTVKTENNDQLRQSLEASNDFAVSQHHRAIMGTTPASTASSTIGEVGFCEICQKDIGPRFQLLSHMLAAHNCSMPSSPPMQMVTSVSSAVPVTSSAASPTDLSGVNRAESISASSESSQSGMHSSANQDSPGSRPSQGRLSHESPNQMRVLCDICQRWMCNKYFLRTHKLNKHGIVDPATPPGPAALAKQAAKPHSLHSNLSTSFNIAGSYSASSPCSTSTGGGGVNGENLEATIDAVVNAKASSIPLSSPTAHNSSNEAMQAAVQAAAAQQYYNTTRDYLTRQYAAATGMPGFPPALAVTHSKPDGTGLPPAPPPAFFDPTGGLLARPALQDTTDSSPPVSSEAIASSASSPNAMATMAGMAAMAAAHHYGLHGFMAPPPPLGFPGAQEHLQRLQMGVQNPLVPFCPRATNGARSTEEDWMPMCSLCGIVCPDHSRLKKHIEQVHGGQMQTDKASSETSNEESNATSDTGAPLDLCVSTTEPVVSATTTSIITSNTNLSSTTNAAMKCLRRACQRQNGHQATAAKRRKLISSATLVENNENSKATPPALHWRFECGASFKSRSLLHRHVTSSGHWSRRAVERAEPTDTTGDIPMTNSSPPVSPDTSQICCPLCRATVADLVQHLVKEHDIEREARLFRGKQQQIDEAVMGELTEEISSSEMHSGRSPQIDQIDNNDELRSGPSTLVNGSICTAESETMSVNDELANQSLNLSLVAQQ